MSGTDIAYSATPFRSRRPRVVAGPLSAYTCPSRCPCTSAICYVLAMRCPVLTEHMGIHGDVRYWPTIRAYAMSGTDLAYGATAYLPAVRPLGAGASLSSIRDCYAMCGTELGFPAMRFLCDF
eukprot:463555-Rhodomonas_salina.1